MSKRKRNLPSFQQRAHDLIHNKKAKTAANQSLDPFDEAEQTLAPLRAHKKQLKEQSITQSTTQSTKQSTKQSAKQTKETTLQSTNLFSSLVDAGESDDDDDQPTLWTTETAQNNNQITNTDQSTIQSSHHLLFDPEQTNRSDYLCYQLIDQLSDVKPALQQISQAALIAIDCEGVMLGRNGSVCLLQIAIRGAKTNNQIHKQSIKQQNKNSLKFKKATTGPSHVFHVFLFDLMSLGTALFDAGLREVLLNASIRKLFYDCRRDCDALFHHYAIEVRGIIDCQLLEVTSRRAQSEPCRALPGLGRVLTKRVPELHPDLIAIKKNMSSRYIDSPDLWAIRPLDRSLLIYASADVACLFFLFTKQSSDIALDTSGHKSIRNTIDEVQIYTDRVWSRMFIDGTESTDVARKQHEDIAKDGKNGAAISEEERELVKKRICTVPEVIAIRAASKMGIFINSYITVLYVKVSGLIPYVGFIACSYAGTAPNRRVIRYQDVDYYRTRDSVFEESVSFDVILTEGNPGGIEIRYYNVESIIQAQQKAVVGVVGYNGTRTAVANHVDISREWAAQMSGSDVKFTWTGVSQPNVCAGVAGGYNISSLASADLSFRLTDGSRVFVNPCGLVTAPECTSRYATSRVSACRVEANNNTIALAGDSPGATVYTSPSQGWLRAEFNDGMVCRTSQRQTVIDYVCSMDAVVPLIESVVLRDECIYTIRIQTRVTCVDFSFAGRGTGPTYNARLFFESASMTAKPVMTNPTTILNSTSDRDDGKIRITIPFPVRVYGAPMTSVLVSGNGWLSFNSTDGGPTGSPGSGMPLPATYNNALPVLAAYLVDLHNSNKIGTAGIFWSIEGTAPNRHLLIRYNEINYFGTRADSSSADHLLSFDIKLYENSNNIDVFYWQITSYTSLVTMGIQASASTMTVVTNAEQPAARGLLLQDYMMRYTYFDPLAPVSSSSSSSSSSSTGAPSSSSSVPSSTVVPSSTAPSSTASPSSSSSSSAPQSSTAPVTSSSSTNTPSTGLPSSSTGSETDSSTLPTRRTAKKK